MRSTIDIYQIKHAASGRWRDIISAVAGIDAAMLDGKHHPCPKCGGNDRYRLIDADAGAVLCNQCFNKENGDGLSAVQWLLSVDFPTACKLVTEHLGMGQVTGKAGPASKESSSRAEADVLHDVYSELLNLLRLILPHKKNLNDRGLSADEIDRREYRSLFLSDRPKMAVNLQKRFGRDVLLSVPGFFEKRNKAGDCHLTIAGAYGIVIPCRDVQGRIVALKIRSEEGSCRYTYMSSRKRGGPGTGSPVHVPLGTPNSCPVARVTEGELKADVTTALSETPTISIAGVGMWKAALTVLKKLCAETVLLEFDADFVTNKDVIRNLWAFATTLQMDGFNVHLEHWLIDSGKGIDDLLVAGGKPELLVGGAAMEAIRVAAEKPDVAPGFDKDERTEIEVTPDEHLVNSAATAALANDEFIYQRGGKLVHVLQDSTTEGGVIQLDNALRIAKLPMALTRERLTANVCFFATIEGGDGPEEKQVTPPKSCVEAVHMRGYWPDIRPIQGVVESPVLRPDGTILDKPGYDPQTGLLFEPSGPIPTMVENPTKSDAIAAIDSLLDVVSEFPFAKPGHKSAWLASLLTPLARHVFKGPAPLFLFDANIRGSGKGLLAHITSLIIVRREMSIMSNPKDDDEARKRITALVMAGAHWCSSITSQGHSAVQAWTRL